MVRYLRAANVKDGSLDLSDVKEMDFSPTEQKIFGLALGDVLVTEGAGSLAAVGASAVWSGELSGTVCFQNTLLRLRPRPGNHARCLMWWARHAYGSGLFASIAGGANIFHLGADRVRLLPASIPPLQNQRAIAEYLDAETARIDAIVARRRSQTALLTEARQGAIDALFSCGLTAPTKLKHLIAHSPPLEWLIWRLSTFRSRSLAGSMSFVRFWRRVSRRSIDWQRRCACRSHYFLSVAKR